MSSRRPDTEPAWLAHGPRSLRATAFVVLFLLAQLAGFLHVSSERHEICQDHGDLVHVEAQAALVPALPVRDASAPQLRATAPEQRGSLHEHCTFHLLNRDATPRPDVALALALGSPSEGRPVRVPSPTLAAPVPILSLAPKQSPPL